MNKEYKRAYDRRYYQEHREQELISAKEYRMNNREKIEARRRAYEAAHREQRREYNRRHYAKRKQKRMEAKL